jgi:pyrroloquinoline quinone (PQQ) biosynthesis protein C
MTFFSDLTESTATERNALLSTPVIVDCLAGRVDLQTYTAFLTEAYHHVKHTVPLLMACGSRLPERHAWLRDGLVEYIDEEHGHEQWILDDIAACGGDPDFAVAHGPSLATELMVSFVYDQIARVNPVSLFGMVFVLEGTSVSIATNAAKIIRRQLDLPKRALKYLLSHGSVDQKHIGDFERIVNRFDNPEDQRAVVHTARVVFTLYAGVFRGLESSAFSVAA